jgi:hypothetical protein
MHAAIHLEDWILSISFIQWMTQEKNQWFSLSVTDNQDMDIAPYINLSWQSIFSNWWTIIHLAYDGRQLINQIVMLLTEFSELDSCATHTICIIDEE